MSGETIGAVIIALFGGGTISAIVTGIIGRYRNRAEARTVEIRGELQIVDAAVKVAEALREDLERIKIEARDLGARVTALEAENKDMDVQLGVLQRENAALKDQVSSLSRQNEVLRDRCDRLEQEKDDLRRQLDEP